MKKLKVAMLGAGGWAIALSMVLLKNGHEVTMWSIAESELQEIQENRQRPRVLPEVAIPETLAVSRFLNFVSECDMVVLATASNGVHPTAARVADCVRRDAVIVSVAKGLEPGTNLRLSQAIEQELPHNPIVVLSGPSHAEEVARGYATTLVSASKDDAAARLVQDAFMNREMRVYLSNDVVGVELGGASKNVIAVAAGIIDGLGLGDNTKAALMTRGITEMARLGEALGGSAQTFAGLTGIGDLIVTCTSMHSRNRRAGILIGQGTPPGEAVQKIGMTVEGISAAKAIRELAQSAGVEMPIVDAIYGVLYENAPIRESIYGLMQRQKKYENEDTWF